MRSNGLDEKYITGGASDYEKFEKWAETVPYTIKNPLYHWTHLELKRYFGIDKLLSGKTAKVVWEKTSELLQKMWIEAWQSGGSQVPRVNCGDGGNMFFNIPTE